LWITKEMLGPDANFEGFHPITDQQVDGHDVLEWRPVGAAETTERGASTPAS
jgi:hypothetical protein